MLPIPSKNKSLPALAYFASTRTNTVRNSLCFVKSVMNSFTICSTGLFPERFVALRPFLTNM